MQGDIYMANNTIYDANFVNATFTGSTYINATQVSNPFWLNLSGGNMTGDINMGGNNIISINNIYVQTPYANDWSNVTITQSQILDLLIRGGTGYLYNDSMYIYFNETMLNNTIIDILNKMIPTQKSGTGYLYNDSNYYYLDEVLLNSTIDQRSNFTSGNANITIIDRVITFITNLFSGKFTDLDFTGVTGINSSGIKDEWVNITGDTMTGSLNMSGNNITDVGTLQFFSTGNAHFTFNETNQTLELWVNNKRQQDWGASTRIYQTATFYDNAYFQNIFLQSAAGDAIILNTSLIVYGTTTSNLFIGNGSGLTEVCLSNGTGCRFNISTIYNGTIYTTTGAQPYLYNDYQVNSIIIHVNESELNKTMSLLNTDYCANGLCGPLNITGNIYSNGTLYINGINAFNIYVLNLTAQQVNTVILMAEVANITNLTVERMTATVILADTFITNGTVTNVCMSNGTGCNDELYKMRAGYGPYLYNDSSYIYFNDSVIQSLNQSITNISGLINITISQITEVKIINVTIAVSEGSGFGQTNYTFPYGSEILRVSVYSTTPTNNYRFSANTSITGDFIDKDRIVHTGNWDVAHRGTTLQNEAINFYIANAIIDENFTVSVRFR